MTLQPSEGPPGSRVVITGQYPGVAPGARSEHANVCWGGCPGGLVYDGVPVQWGPGDSFSLALAVPDTAWLQDGQAHPLASGTYQVSVQCLESAQEGCALDGGQASSEFHLVTSPPDRCVTHRPCAQLHLEPGHAAPGDLVAISGWAPLAQIIGVPFGYQAQVFAAPGPPLGPDILKDGLATQVTVAKAALRVDPAPAWSTLNASDQLWTETAGAGQLTADPTDPSRFGYCAPGQIRVTTDGGTAFSNVPTLGMASALTGTTYRLAAPGPPSCSTVSLDPNRPESFYAGLVVNPNGGAPPFDVLGLVTTDSGAHWSLVPTPPGSSPGLFSDFRTDRSGVDALFNLTPGPDSSGAGVEVPPVPVERSTDGGASWSPDHLACPGSGACVTFGGFVEGNCAMNGSAQTLEYSTDAGLTWMAPNWPTTVNSCGEPQLVALANGSMVLIDPASGYLVRRSDDGGRNWMALGIPLLPGSSPDQVDAPANGGTTMLPNGALLTTPTGGSWYLLKTGSRAWCQVNGTGSNGRVTVDSLPVSIADRIWWLRTNQEASATQATPMSRLLSSLSCQ
jgi:hypothetical protein